MKNSFLTYAASNTEQSLSMEAKYKHVKTEAF